MKRVSKIFLVVMFVMIMSACSLFEGTKGEPLPGVHNVALQKPVKASSDRGDFLPEKAVDGVWNNDEFWSPSTLEEIHWLEIDLKGSFVITHAEIWLGVPNSDTNPESTLTAPQSFKLQYHSSGDWVDIPGASIDDNPRSNGKVEFEFENPVTTDKVRLYAEQSKQTETEALRIREVLVFGSSAN